MNNELESYQEGNRIARVYRRDKQFRVCLFDCYFETQQEQFFDNITEAKQYAERWITL
jgi:biotin synthase-like enzyme